MRQPKTQEESFNVHDRLHSAPKGLLRYYILHKIAQKPIHGYEIIQDIDSKTEGAWRPGAGSLYPILKKLVSEGLIKAEPEPSDEATRRVYHITPKGVESLAHAKLAWNVYIPGDRAKYWMVTGLLFQPTYSSNWSDFKNEGGPSAIRTMRSR